MKLLLREEHKMSTNYTQNYSLCQWEPQDKVQRVDFNGDNAKIDAALTAQQAVISQLKAQAFTPSNLPFVVGYYNGGAGEVRLGFRPRAVLVMPQDGHNNDVGSYSHIRGGLAIDGLDLDSERTDGPGLKITDTGFRAANIGASGSIFAYRLNLSGVKYMYIAFR